MTQSRLGVWYTIGTATMFFIITVAYAFLSLTAPSDGTRLRLLWQGSSVAVMEMGVNNPEGTLQTITHVNGTPVFNFICDALMHGEATDWQRGNVVTYTLQNETTPLTITLGAHPIRAILENYSVVIVATFLVPVVAFTLMFLQRRSTVIEQVTFISSWSLLMFSINFYIGSDLIFISKYPFARLLFQAFITSQLFIVACGMVHFFWLLSGVKVGTSQVAVTLLYLTPQLLCVGLIALYFAIPYESCLTWMRTWEWLDWVVVLLAWTYAIHLFFQLDSAPVETRFIVVSTLLFAFVYGFLPLLFGDLTVLSWADVPVVGSIVLTALLTSSLFQMRIDYLISQIVGPGIDRLYSVLPARWLFGVGILLVLLIGYITHGDISVMIVVMALLLGVTLLRAVYREGKQREIETENARIIERKNIEQRMHDYVKGGLSNLVIWLKRAGDTPREDLLVLASGLLDEVTNITDELQQKPPSLERGLIAAVEQMKAEFERYLSVHIKVEDMITYLPKTIEENAHAIIYTVLDNARKHANAENVHLSLVMDKNILKITSWNDGDELPADYKFTRKSFHTIRDRAELLGGTFISPEPGKLPFTISVTLPVDPTKHFE